MPRHANYVPQGVIPAVLLPFDNDFAIDEASFRKHLRDVAAVEGLSAITVNAHSTEVGSCSFEEQKRVLEIAQDEIGARLPLVNGIWADGSIEAARIARMATQGGASALLVFPPAPFTLGQSPAIVLAHFQTHRRRKRSPADRVSISACNGPGLSEGDVAETVRGSAVNPRDQGLDRQCAAS
jgi:4-hydroxy-tetrahydrodipicolinate synthase